MKSTYLVVDQPVVFDFLHGEQNVHQLCFHNPYGEFTARLDDVVDDVERAKLQVTIGTRAQLLEDIGEGFDLDQET